MPKSLQLLVCILHSPLLEYTHLCVILWLRIRVLCLDPQDLQQGLKCIILACKRMGVGVQKLRECAAKSSHPMFRSTCPASVLRIMPRVAAR